MKCIILAGGSGTRLCISRAKKPKQFVKLFEDKSLFQLTIERNIKICKNILIVSNEEQYFLAQDQAAQTIKTPQMELEYLLEPIGRNTAAAIALSCFNFDTDDVVLVVASDHLIKDQNAYEEAVFKAKKLANEGFLVTFGISPSFPHTGYGYIEADGYDVRAFYEKPNLIDAQKYILAKNFYWNSGMFCFKAGVFLDELKKYDSKIYEMSKIAYQNGKKDKESRLLKELKIGLEDMLNIPENSIDYAVMEKSKSVKVIPCDIKWSDLGSFEAIYDEMEKDSERNSQNENLISISSKNNLVMSSKKTALIDVEDMIIVDTDDALLVSKKGSSQKIKEIVSLLKKQNSDLPNIHLTAHRPWGDYTVLEQGEYYKIKKIRVKQGKRLSLQKHFHRNEHWIVVSGAAIVNVNGEEKFLRANESIYIPSGVLHRLENPGKIDLVLIEAQVGAYLGEDDIVRVEDDFGRFE